MDHTYDLSERGIFDKGLKFKDLYFFDIFIDQDNSELMYKVAGFDAKSIAEKIENALKSNVVSKNNFKS